MLEIEEYIEDGNMKKLYQNINSTNMMNKLQQQNKQVSKDMNKRKKNKKQKKAYENNCKLPQIDNKQQIDDAQTTKTRFMSIASDTNKHSKYINYNSSDQEGTFNKAIDMASVTMYSQHDQEQINRGIQQQQNNEISRRPKTINNQQQRQNHKVDDDEANLKQQDKLKHKRWKTPMR